MKAIPLHLYTAAAEPAPSGFFRHADRSPRPGALSPSECRTLIQHALRHYAPQEGTVGHGHTSRVDKTLRRSTLRWLNKEDRDLRWLFDRIDGLILEANMKSFGFEISGYTDVQLTEYDAADEAIYDWHCDSYILGRRPCDRKLTLCIQLSDPADYAGGRFEMEGYTFAENEFISQGSAIVFPSYARHRANLVTAGRRYSLVTWVWGRIL